MTVHVGKEMGGKEWARLICPPLE